MACAVYDPIRDRSDARQGALSRDACQLTGTTPIRTIAVPAIAALLLLFG
jgi:hypothetical protein